MIRKASLESLTLAKELLSNEQLVALPTETVYGLAGNGLSFKAVSEIYRIKRRPSNNPLILHFGSLDQIDPFVDLAPKHPIAARYSKLTALWPGPLTIIMPASSKVPAHIKGNLQTVAVRIPNQEFTLKLLSSLDFPLAAPSANISFYTSPTSAEHVYQDFGEKLPLIIDGGNTQIGLESTVISLATAAPTLLRPGVLSKEQLENILGEEVLSDSSTTSHATKVDLSSPGLFAKHYSPRTPLRFLSSFSNNSPGLKIGVILFENTSPNLENLEPRVKKILSKRRNLEEVAAGIYAALRELDQLDLDFILVDECPEKGLGAAIMNRLQKAVIN